MIGGPFGQGFAAPLGTLSMLLALLAAGLWAATLGGRETGRLPIAVLAGLLAGAAILEFGVRLPYAGYVVPGSVVLLGLLVAIAAHLPAPAALVMAAVAGLWLGQTGAGPAGDSPLVWLGFIAGTLTVVAAGIGFVAILSELASSTAVRIGGGAIAAAGALIFSGLF